MANSNPLLHYVGADKGDESAKQVLGVIFDMDGTLIHEGIDYLAMRADLGIPHPKDVILEIKSVEDPMEQKKLWDIVEEHETAGRVNLRAHDGASELLESLRSHGVRIGLFTRNSSHGIEEMKKATGFCFDYELSRDFEPPKPSPHGALEMARLWGLQPSSIVFVGDSADDIKCGIAAGMKSVLFDPDSKRNQDIRNSASIVITSMHELKQLLLEGVHM